MKTRTKGWGTRLYVNPQQVTDHIADQEKGIQRINDLRKDYDKAKRKEDKERIKQDIKTETEKLKRHDKEIKQMPKKPEAQ